MARQIEPNASLPPAVPDASAVFQIYDDDRDDNGYPEETLPAPACSLTHLMVCDNGDSDFTQYPLLLNKSHDSLEHMELSGIFNVHVGNPVVEAVSHCSRLRSLALVENDFPTSAIIAACAPLQCLTLQWAPSDEEIAALRDARALRELRLIFSFGRLHPDGFIGQNWPRLKKVLPKLPGLRILRVVEEDAPRCCPVSYPLLRAECARRRILFSTTLHGDDWVMWAE